HDYTAFTGAVDYFVFTARNPLVSRFYPGSYVNAVYRNSDGVLESGQISTWVEVETKPGGDMWIEPQFYHENVLDVFSIVQGVNIPAGSYNFWNGWLFYAMPTGQRLRFTAQ